MLAAWGFLLTGLCFSIFASTFKTMVIDKTKLRLNGFTYAYFCLALALVVWAVAAANGDGNLLKNSVLIGDGLLLAGSVFLVHTLVGPKKTRWVWLSVFIAVGLLIIRGKYYPPVPYMDGGVLVFNSQTPVAVGLATLFLAIWLPANAKVAKSVAHKVKHDDIGTYYIAIYTAATISALVFLASRRVLAVVLSFVAIGICFIMLIASNLLIDKLESRHGAR